MNTSILKRHFPFIICLLSVLFLSTYKLTESPPIWIDEGINTQVSRNVVDNGVYRLQVAPQTYVSAGFVSTSYPVTLPVSLSFYLFGVGLLQARIVMVLFILGLFLVAYALARGEFSSSKFGAWVVPLTLLLIVTFGPLYGDGKNVLGEIPGMFFLLLGFLCIQKVERSSREISHSRNLIFAGLFFSLCFVTKPNFILICPAVLALAWLIRKKIVLKEWLFAILALLTPFIIWLCVQFTNDSLSSILSIYANPHSIGFLVSLKENFLRFFTEAQPAYFFWTFMAWCVTLVIRRIKKIHISAIEYSAVIYSLFVLLSYLHTTGYYRYFFQAQFLALFYIVYSVCSLCREKSRISTILLYFVFPALILFQLYQTSYKSWVAIHYTSHRTELIEGAISHIPSSAHFYLYRVPEIAILLPSSNYSQYFEATESIAIGYNTLSEINTGTAPYIITTNEMWQKNQSLFKKYGVKENVDGYMILVPNSPHK